MSSIAFPRARGAAAGTALLLAACSSPEAEAPGLRVDALGPDVAAAIVAANVSAGLTARDPAGQVVPGLAQSWRVADDGLAIVFRLRPATFADGSPVRAADVVASLARARRDRDTRDLLAGITGVSAPLPDVIEVRLSTPQPELLELLATPDLAIRARGRGAEAGPFLPVADPPPGRPGAGAGPADILGGALQRLERNPAFHAAASVAVGTVALRSVQPELALARFARGETDLVLGGGLDGLGPARVSPRRQSLVLERPRAAMMLFVNHRHPLLGDVRVRRALSLAIDREALGPSLFGTAAAAPVPGLVPAAVPGAAPAPDWAALPLVARQEEARRLLAEAGVGAGGERPRLVVTTGRSPGDARLMQAVAANLAEIGIDLALAPLEPDAFARALSRGEAELLLVRLSAPAASPLSFLLPLTCGRNRLGVCLEEADALVRASWTAPSLAERQAALAAAERLWTADAAAIGLVQPIAWSLVSPRLQGFAANPGGAHDLRHLAFEPDGA